MQINFPTAAGGGTREVSLSDFPATIRERLALHGLQQKVADAVANAKAKGWDKDECVTRCEAVIEGLMSGDWSGRSRVASFADFIRKALIAAAKAADKRAGKEDSAANYTARAEAAMAKAAAEPESPVGRFVAAKRDEWDAMQQIDTDLEI